MVIARARPWQPPSLHHASAGPGHRPVSRRIPFAWEGPDPIEGWRTPPDWVHPVAVPDSYTHASHIPLRETRDRLLGRARGGGLTSERAEQVVTESLRKALRTRSDEGTGKM